VTSFFEIKVCVFCVFRENDKTDLRQKFFSGFRRKHLLLQPALKSTAPGFQALSPVIAAVLLCPFLKDLLTEWIKMRCVLSTPLVEFLHIGMAANCGFHMVLIRRQHLHM